MIRGETVGNRRNSDIGRTRKGRKIRAPPGGRHGDREDEDNDKGGNPDEDGDEVG